MDRRIVRRVLHRRDKDLRLAMYEELLPYWKAACQFAKYGTGEDSEPGWFTGWGTELKTRGIYLVGNSSHPNPIKGRWEWINAGPKPWQWDCLVLGVMLFTWEAGLEP